MKISIITINYKTPETTAQALEKACRVLDGNLAEVILIDNNSADGSREYLEEKFGGREEVKLIFNSQNLGFAGAVNQGINSASGDYVLLLNSDVFLDKSFLKLLEYARKHPEAGILAPQMRYPDSKLQYSFGRTPTLLNEFFRLFWLYRFLPWGSVTAYNFFTRNNFSRVSRVGWVSGGCMLISKKLISQIGSLDENYFFGVEDMDFCFRARQEGYEVIYFPRSRVIHYHGFSSGGKRSLFKLSREREGILYFYKKFFPARKLRKILLKNMYNLKMFLVKKLEERKTNKIKDLVLAVTYSCNARCQRCFIWKSQDRRELTGEDLASLPRSLKDINISGGEPFLAQDFLGIVKTLKENNPRAGMVISTNGLAPELIKKRMAEALKINPGLGVAVSLDGGPSVHDKLRGVPGAYKKALQTLKSLKDLGVKNLKISFTLGDENIRELKKIYGLAQDSGVEFSLTAVHSSENFFAKENKIKLAGKMEEELNWLIQQELKGFNPKKWARALYAYGLREFLKTGRRIYPDYSGKYNIFIDQQKRVFPCDVADKSIGKLDEQGLHLNLGEKDKSCEQSWMICTARPAIKKHWLRSIIWIIKKKIFSL